MKNLLKQLNDIFSQWSECYPLSGAVIALPSVYKNMEEYIKTCFTARERDSILDIRNPKRRLSRMAGRLAARKALLKLDAQKFAPLSSGFIEILNDDCGSPFLTRHSHIHVSISHSGPVAAAVVSKRNVGIDIEKTEERPDSFIRCYFQTAEQRWINKESPGRHKKANILWTRKEAVSKLLGLGGRIPFKKLPALEQESHFKLFSHCLDNYCISLAISPWRQI